MRGGKRVGAGRKPGLRNKRTEAMVATAIKAGQLPHEFLCAVSQGQKIAGHNPTFAERMDAAKAAAPFYAPRLNAIDATIDSSVTHKVVGSEPATPEEWEREFGDAAGSGATH